jgi:cytochrome c peroxidase
MRFRLIGLCTLLSVTFGCGSGSGGGGGGGASDAAVESKAVLPQEESLASLALLGKYVFFDEISDPPRQACASCHVPAMGWTGHVPAINRNGVAIPGANPHTVGGRKSPTSAYASFSPPFATTVLPGSNNGCADGSGVRCIGGLFWDGRAEGRPAFMGSFFTGGGATTHVGLETIAGLAVEASFSRFIGPLADQALGPFPNDVEQNVADSPDDPPGLPGATSVCRHVASAQYGELYRKAFGEPIDCAPESTGGKVGISFKRLALALSAWQHSDEVNSFSSPRDKCIGPGSAVDADGVFPCDNLSPAANLGHDLFFGLNTSGRNPGPKNANCARCHNSVRPPAGSPGSERGQLYTDHTYHNIGLPPNFEIANFNETDPDPGLSQHADPSNPAAGPFAGHFKTPTLRNVDKRRGTVTKAYMHNGYFTSLEDVVHFYNTAAEPSKLDPVNCPPGTAAAHARTRDCWPAAEIANRMSRGTALVGRLGLTAEEEAALVAYMQTLTDANQVQAPTPYISAGR